MFKWLQKKLYEDAIWLVRLRLDGKQTRSRSSPVATLLILFLLAAVYATWWAWWAGRAWLVWLAGIAGIGLIILLAGYMFALGVVVAEYKGIVTGARYTLEHPPQPGETGIVLTWEGEQIWESEKIDFQPGESQTKILRISPRSAYPDPEDRRKIVEHYRREIKLGKVGNKEAWAQSNYGISSKTLRRYEKELLQK